MKKGIYKSNSKNKNTILALFTIVAIAAAGITSLSSLPTFALTYQEAVDVQFTFNPTVSVNLSGDLTIYNLSPGNSADSNIITVRAGSNEVNGYTLYSTVGSSSSNYTDLRLSSSNTTNVFTNLSSNKATLAAFSDDTWGYSYCNTTNDCDNSTTYWVSGNVGSTSTGYNGLPIFNASNNTTGVILADSNSANETELKFKIGAKASSSQLAGTYTNIVNFINVAKVVTTSYTVNYNDASSEATGMPTSQSGTTTNSTVTLSSTVPARDGYIFKGWCNVSTNDDTCSGIVTMPGHVYALNTSASSTTVNMYAMWGAANTFIQNLDPALCTSTPTTVVDSRDGTEYRIARLADGNCWMLDNMALDLTDSTVQANLTPSTTNASAQALSCLKTGSYGGNTCTTPYSSDAVRRSWVSSDDYTTAPMIATDSVSSGVTCTSGSSSTCPHNDGSWSSTDIVSISNPPELSSVQGKIGVYYSFCAASAGSFCSHPGDSTDYYTGDICPTSWRIPTAGDYSQLLTAYNNNFQSFIIAFSAFPSGRISGGGMGLESHVSWTSSIVENLPTMHAYNAQPYWVASTQEKRSMGLSVRCMMPAT